MMSDRVLEKLERFADIGTKFTQLMDKIPRVAEMAAVAIFAGRASERVGGTFANGALGGIAADGLAHSQIPNNQIGGLALALYFSAIGLMNMLPGGPPVLDPLTEAQKQNLVGAGGTTLDPSNVYSGLAENEKIMSAQDCGKQGGTVVRIVPRTGLVVCANAQPIGGIGGIPPDTGRPFQPPGTIRR